MFTELKNCVTYGGENELIGADPIGLRCWISAAVINIFKELDENILNNLQELKEKIALTNNYMTYLIILLTGKVHAY